MDRRETVIFIVDDDLAVREALKFALELEGLIVHTCPGGPELLEHPDLKRAQCLVLNYKLPRMDGLDLMQRLVDRHVTVPVILVAGAVTPTLRERARRAGVQDVLEKPLLDGALLTRIRDLTG